MDIKYNYITINKCNMRLDGCKNVFVVGVFYVELNASDKVEVMPMYGNSLLLLFP